MATLDNFNRRYGVAMENFSEANKALSANYDRIKVLEELQKQLRHYGRTKDNYKLYNAAKDKEKFLRENYGIEGDVILHETAKKYFDKYTAEHGKPLPKMSEVIAELTSLKATKKQQQSEYNAAKAEHDNMIKLKVNLQSLLGKDAVREYKNDLMI